MKRRFQLTRRRIEALVIMIGALAYIWSGRDLPPFYRTPGVPGPTVFPSILGAIMVAAAIWLLIAPGEQPATEKAADAIRDARLRDRWPFFFMWGLLMAYVVFLPYLGFVVCSALLLIALFFLLGERRWYLAVPVALVFTVAIYVLFARGLQIRLPLGIFETLFR